MNWRRYIFIVIVAFKTSYGQLRIDTTHSTEYLVKEVLVKNTNNLSIEGIKYTGSKKSIGVFSSITQYNSLIEKGVIISTGYAYGAIGPNNNASMGYKSYGDGETTLESIAGGKTHDAAVLEFDFTPTTNHISFNFFFASEEYPEYVKKEVNDVFAFFLINEKLRVHKNLAILPTGNIPISIDNINSAENESFYIENGVWDSGNISKWKNDRKKGELAYIFQFDGMTKMLKASSEVVPGETYHLKLAIADVGDDLYDSAIFLEAGSLTDDNTGKEMEKNNSISINEITKMFKDDVINISDSSVSVNIKINFEFDSYQFKGKETFEELEKVLHILISNKDLNVKIYGHTDKVGSNEFNLNLSERRAGKVSDFLGKKGIESSRIRTKGFGATKPISKIANENRRVEFVFWIQK